MSASLAGVLLTARGRLTGKTDRAYACRRCLLGGAAQSVMRPPEGQ